MLLAPPPFWEVYNNSNLVNNVVFKKLTTKLAGMKVLEMREWELIIEKKFSLNFSKFLLKFSEKLLKFSIKFTKFVQTLANFSQITIFSLI